MKCKKCNQNEVVLRDVIFKNNTKHIEARCSEGSCNHLYYVSKNNAIYKREKLIQNPKKIIVDNSRLLKSKEKYFNNRAFFNLVNSLTSILKSGHFDIPEIQEALNLASIKAKQ